jgi:HPr kinase/phosphorylase
MATEPPINLHATCLVWGEKGLLIRGASGSGKSALADALVSEAARIGSFARLVADDRVIIYAQAGRLVVQAHPVLRGQIERRGLGLVQVPYLETTILHAIIDLTQAPNPRFPEDDESSASVLDMRLPRCALSAKLPMERKIQLLLAFCAGL